MVFGELPVQPATLANFVIEQIPKRAAAADNSNTAWTKAMREALGELGRSLGFLVSPDATTSQGEYLLDLIWQRQPPCCDIVLAAESEWGNHGAVLEDFEKLMHVKSPLKLMISNLSGREKARLLAELRNSYLIPFHQHVRDEIYLLVNFVGGAGSAECYQFVPAEDGSIETAEITPFQIARSLAAG